jgi:two-component system response regulator GlrR
VTLEIPPLRERREDIRQLVDSYLEHFRNQTGKPVSRVSDAAMQALVRYDWPGNVRELVNAVERAVLIASGEELKLADVPERIARAHAHFPRSGAHLHWSFETLPTELLEKPLIEAKRQITAAFETRYLTDLLRSTNGGIGETARRARINERSLYDLMRKHALKKEDFRPRPHTRRRSRIRD